MLRVADIPFAVLESLLHRYGLRLIAVADDSTIPGSYWGEPEAGIIRNDVYARGDTPVHSLLHEACHLICMTSERRATLHGDAGGDDLEESAVCYLQLVLADCIEGVGRDRLMQDMDAYGYSFRLGSTRRWFEQDADDARNFLLVQRLLTQHGEPSFTLRL